MPLSATDAINPAFQHAQQQLFRPFRFAQWARLAFVGLLAGEAGSGGGCNSGFNSSWPNQHRGSDQSLGTALPSQLAQLASHRAMLAGLIAALIVAGFALTVLFAYINSRMRFILFDSIVAKECHIRQGWVRRRRPGRRLFVWQILLMLATFAAFFLLIGIPVACAWALGWLTRPGEHVFPLVLGGIVLFFLLLALVIVLAVVGVMTKDFVVPHMALEDVTAFEGWRRLWLSLKAEKGGYAGYIGVKIALAIAAGIALSIVTIIVLLVLLIPVGGIGVVAVLAGKAAGLTWNAYGIALAVIAGCIVLALFIFVAAMISVPVIVFFPAYSIYFYASRYPPLASLLSPQPAS